MKNKGHRQQSKGGSEDNFCDIAATKEPSEWKMRPRNALRRDVQNWLESHQRFEPGDVRLAVEELTEMHDKYGNDPQVWQDEVINLKHVQDRIMLIVEHIKVISGKNERTTVVASLKKILTSFEDVAVFSGFRKIMISLNNLEGVSGYPPLKLDDITQLPGVVKNRLEQIGRMDYLNLIKLQGRLESCLKNLSTGRVKSYEHLITVSVLQLFGFDVVDFVFQHYLSKNDFTNISNMLVTHLRNFHTFSSKLERHAYILKIAMLNVHQREAAVSYINERIPGGPCRELKTMDLECLKSTIDKVLSGKRFTSDLETLLHFFKQQLYVAGKKKIQEDEAGADIFEIDESVMKMLDTLQLTSYYPQKLGYKDVIMLTSSIHDDVNKKPTSLPELPWYFMKHVIAVDSDTREKCHVVDSEGDSSDSSDDDSDDSDDDISDSVYFRVHPLDLIYTIFLCVDDFLRQELIDKMARCQYAVPFIMPPAQSGDQRSLMLLWGLKGVTRNFCYNNAVVNKSLLDTQAPLVACMSLGEETFWKSRLSNAIAKSSAGGFSGIKA